MLHRDQKLALYMEGNLSGPYAKMGFGILRYSPNPIACIIDSTQVGADVAALTQIPRQVPVVGSVSEAIAMSAEVFVLGIAPVGGLIPSEWLPAIDEAVAGGLSVLNGLHDPLAPRYPSLPVGQWVWDVRLEPPGLQPGTGAAACLQCQRVLMVGTDMAIGKMTAGLEILRAAKERGIRADFVATGQIGIAVTGAGVPLDAIRVDFASGAIEREVLRAAAGADLVIIEGQGSLVNPASSANLPLLRGSCPTHLVMCHRAGQTHLRSFPEIAIPPLRKVTDLYEDLAEACGLFPRPKTAAVALNTSLLSDSEAEAECRCIEQEVGMVCTDPIRHGPGRLLDVLIAS